MPTQILTVGAASASESVAQAIRALSDGRLVVFPTETVYGVGASVGDMRAVARLRGVKGRENAQAFTVHIGRRRDAARFLSAPTPLVRRLARKAWPGPVTLVLSEERPAETEIGRTLSREQLDEVYHERSIGLRVPDHPIALQLLAGVASPVVASSANRSGKPPPMDVEAAMRELDGEVDLALDGGRTRYSGPSTIVRVSGDEWSIARAGVIDERAIRRMATSLVLFVCTGNTCRSPMAEHLFRQKLAARLSANGARLGEMGYAVQSAGTAAWAGGAMSQGSRDELAQRGIDGAAHRSQPLTVELVQQAERIFVMSEEHREAVLAIAPGAAARVALLDASGPIADPVGGTAEGYRRCAEQIEGAVEARLEEFLHEDLSW